MELEGVMPDTTAPMLRRLYNDKEWHEETGWLEFKFRHYDPMIGRFTGIDPVSEKFAHVSPFNYAENRVPNGIDLWGLQFIDFNESHYFIFAGQTWLKTNYFDKIYGIGRPFSGGIDGNGNRYIGRTIPISQVELSVNGSKLPTSNGLAQSLKWAGEQLANTYENSPRKKNGSLNGSYSSSKDFYKKGAELSAFGKIGLVIIALDLTLQFNKNVKAYLDAIDSDDQRKYISKSWEAVTKGIRQGIIIDKYLNMEDLSKIADFVFQGTPIQDKALMQIARDVYNNIAREDRSIPESGLDNFHRSPLEFPNNSNIDQN